MIGRLTLDQLRVLVTIDDVGCSSAAAVSRLGCNRRSVRTLEEIQSVSLFDRTHRRPTWTPLGRVFVDQARVILAGADRFEAIAVGTRKGLGPVLTLAIDSLVPTEPLIDSLRALRRAFPDLPRFLFYGATR